MHELKTHVDKVLMHFKDALTRQSARTTKLERQLAELKDDMKKHSLVGRVESLEAKIK